MTTKKKTAKKPVPPKSKKEMKKLALYLCMDPNGVHDSFLIDEAQHETLEDAKRNIAYDQEDGDVQYLIEFELEVPPKPTEAVEKKILLKDAGNIKIFKLT